MNCSKCMHACLPACPNAKSTQKQHHCLAARSHVFAYNRCGRLPQKKRRIDVAVGLCVFFIFCAKKSSGRGWGRCWAGMDAALVNVRQAGPAPIQQDGHWFIDADRQADRQLCTTGTG
jgi:hypothetical protein